MITVKIFSFFHLYYFTGYLGIETCDIIDCSNSNILVVHTYRQQLEI